MKGYVTAQTLRRVTQSGYQKKKKKREGGGIKLGPKNNLAWNLPLCKSQLARGIFYTDYKISPTLQLNLLTLKTISMTSHLF